MSEITVYKGSPSGEILEKVPTPEPKDTEALVRVTHSGICGSDLHFVNRDMVLGHEGTGIVEKIGPMVRDLKMCFSFPFLFSVLLGWCLELIARADTEQWR